MHVLLALLGAIALIAFFVIRTHRAVGAARELNAETKPLQHKARSAISAMIGTPLGRVSDPALAAAVLMIQLVRSEGAMTAGEKSEILSRLKDPIGAADPQNLFERAWRLTAQEAFFSQVSDEVTPVLARALSDAEMAELVEMLRGVARSGGRESDLQASSIIRFSKRLTTANTNRAFTRP